MNCDEIKFQIGGLLDRALTPAESKIVEEHLSLCASCRVAFKQFESLQVVLRNGPNYTPSTELDDRVMSAYRRQHRLGLLMAKAGRRWRMLFLGSVNIRKPSLAIAVAGLLAALLTAFQLGRIAASRAVTDARLHAGPTASPAILAAQVKVPIEIPVKRDRIVSLKAPVPRGKAKPRPPRPNSVDEAGQPVAERPLENLAGDLKPAAASLSVSSLENFEPIKGATGRVIEVSKQH